MRLLFALLVLLLWPAHAHARSQHIAVSLIASSEEPRPGSTITLGLRFQPQPGWHGYWTNPGDSGLAPQVDWKAPAGVTFGSLRHPAPTILRVAGINSYVHAGEHVLLSSVRIPASVAPGTKLPVKAALNWLACSDSLCVPERATVEIELTAGSDAPSAHAGVIRRAQASLPRAIAADGRFTLEGRNLRFRPPAGLSLDVSRARFFPDANGFLDASTMRATSGSQGQVLSAIATGPAPSIISGVLSDTRRAYQVRFAKEASTLGSTPAFKDALELDEGEADTSIAPEPRAGVSEEAVGSSALRAGLAPAPGPTEYLVTSSMSLLIAVLGAFAGGLLLNLMPCVFPILSLKALSLARSGVSKREARMEALGYTVGALIGTGLLGMAIVLMRQAGVEVGWSFQLQNPAIVLFLLLLTFGTALNLAGLFELPSLSFEGRGGRPFSGSIGTGALAAFIATPCSGPFMAAALGAAMLLPIAGALLVFLALGLGLALPFLIIGFFPPAQKFLPKPGPWMATFRRLLAFPMLITAIGLLWLLGRQGGVTAMTVAVVVALILGTGLWWVGLRQQGRLGRSWLPLVPVIVGIAIVSLALPPTSTAARAAALVKGKEPFSEHRLAELRRTGTPVFVDFTADWCLTCKVNERVAIDRDATQDAFRRAGVVTLEGDWTNGDPAITRFLAQNGRNSIPFYLFVRSGKPPEVLPQLLSSAMLIERAQRSEKQRNQPLETP